MQGEYMAARSKTVPPLIAQPDLSRIWVRTYDDGDFYGHLRRPSLNNIKRAKQNAARIANFNAIAPNLLFCESLADFFFDSRSSLLESPPLLSLLPR
jgi:methionine salvage enolase-phosphatase E1